VVPACRHNARHLIIAAVLAVGVLAAVGTIWIYLRSAAPSDNEKKSFPPPVDPRLAYQGRFLNIDPSVRYVGSAECFPCHDSIAESYNQHPMARSLMPIGKVEAAKPSDKAHNNPFLNEDFKSLFRVDRDQNRVWHRQTRLDAASQPIFERAMEVQYVFGSGTRGHSYLIMRDGYLFQSPISWFTQKDKWDLSPNFTREMLGGRPVHAFCLYCHANHVTPWEGAINRYREPIFDGHGIGCERCHGPGEKHVQDPGRFDPETHIDYTIVNPRKLGHAERESVCQQCHLAGEGRVLPYGRRLNDFRPGLPLDSCWSIFVETDTARHQEAVNHVEQMYQSRCFEKSFGDNKLGCISCHNPHEHIGADRRVPYYRNRCLQCHTDGATAPGKVGCAMPRDQRITENKEDSCIACHMRRYEAADIPHNASTNHRILRHPTQQDAAKPHAAAPLSRNLLQHFHNGQVENNAATLQAAALQRDLGMALSRMTTKRRLPAGAIDQAINLLGEAVIHFPEDVDAWEERGKALYFRKRSTEALAAFETALAKDATREISLVHAALITQGQGKADLALDYWKQALAVNPWAMEYAGNLTVLFAGKEDWSEVQKHSLAWLRLDPENIDARQLQMECLIRAGKVPEARAEMARIEALNPPQLAQVKSWFAARTRNVEKGGR
jgi:tetratricopeptide (TPR) repeat protein